MNKKHQIFNFAKDLNLNEGLELKEGKVVLKNGFNHSTIDSSVIEIIPSKSVVASWACITSKEANCEVKVRLRVEEKWSDYVSYGKWGFGLENEAHYQENSLIKLVEDEMKILDDKLADAIQYQIILERTSQSVESPKLSLITFALEILNYHYDVDTNNLPLEVYYDVPKLCQLVVPEIGNSICSPTSMTMLLKYKGIDLSVLNDEYEHRAFALLSRDYGNEIFGNWVYTTVAATSFGVDACVERMYSLDELRHHLATTGPIALSVRGRMLSDKKDYTTKGHLLVCNGYKYVDGSLYFICNDPNVNEVSCLYSEEIIQTTWRGVAYTIK